MTIALEQLMSQIKSLYAMMNKDYKIASLDSLILTELLQTKYFKETLLKTLKF
jgi:hypothetical protein